VSSAFCACVITSVVRLGLARLSHLSRCLGAWAILRRPFAAGIEEIFSLCSNHRAVRSFVIPIT